MLDAALLVLRGVSGGLLAGHGAQKVFGAFEGPGPEGTRGMMEKLRMQPAEVWGHAAGLSELVGGGLTALGALSPIGPLTSLAPMVMATRLAHWGKPVWVSRGGPELPLVNMAAFTALALSGPGRLSVDGALGIRLPRWVGVLTAAGVLGGAAFALATRAPEEQSQEQQQQPPAPRIPDPEDREDLATAAEQYREQEVELRAGADAARRRARSERPA
jgi:putative oxidoreductase